MKCAICGFLRQDPSDDDHLHGGPKPLLPWLCYDCDCKLFHEYNYIRFYRHPVLHGWRTFIYSIAHD